MQRQYKAFSCMYHLRIRLKSGNDHPGHGCLPVCAYTCGAFQLDISIQRRALTVARRIAVDHIEGKLLIAIPHIASGLQVPGKLTSSVHIGHSGICSRQIRDCLGIIGTGNFKRPGRRIRTESRSHHRIRHHGFSHVYHRKYNADRLSRIRHRSHPASADH